MESASNETRVKRFTLFLVGRLHGLSTVPAIFLVIPVDRLSEDGRWHSMNGGGDLLHSPFSLYIIHIITSHFEFTIRCTFYLMVAEHIRHISPDAFDFVFHIPNFSFSLCTVR